MLRRLVPSMLLALACATLIGAAAPVAGALSRDAQVKQNVRLLKTYIDGYAAGRSYVFPAASVVKKGGGLTAPVWPVNPWTGKPMAPGPGRGAYTYTPSADGASYTLVGRLASGKFAVSGGMPGWLQTERGVAAADHAALAATQAELLAARDQAAKNGLAMIQEAARNLAKGMGAPPEAAILTYANLHSSWPGWPTSAFDGQPMQQGSAPGQFTYTPGADGSWTFVAHLTSGDYTLTQGAYDWAAYRDALTIEGATLIGYGLELEAIQSNDLYPASISSATLDTVDPWPTNPYTNSSPMADSDSKGDYHYARTGMGDGYTLVANLTDGSTYDVAAWTRPLFDPLWRLRVSLKDFAAQGYAQVLKDFVDEWKQTHGGALPTVDQMSSSGEVAAAHTWWPKSPWSLSPMASGTGTGSFEYTPGGSGDFTILLHQSALPALHGDPSTVIPATYTAQ